MKKFKKVEELEARRYYQKDYFGVFLDVEKRSDERKIFMGVFTPHMTGEH